MPIISRRTLREYWEKHSNKSKKSDRLHRDLRNRVFAKNPVSGGGTFPPQGLKKSDRHSTLNGEKTMKISQIIHWLLRMFVYACMGTSAMLLVYDFENDCWFCSGDKSNQAEAKTYISSMNRGQQAYYVEKNTFSNSIDDLRLEIKKDTSAYSYRILSPMNPVQNVEELKPSPLDESRKIAFATPKKPGFKSYIGIAWIFPISDGKLTTKRILCESGQEGILYQSILPKISNNEISCPPGFEVLR